MIVSKIKNFKFTNLFFIITFLILMVIYFTIKILIDFYTNEITVSVYHFDVMRKSAYFLIIKCQELQVIEINCFIIHNFIFLKSLSKRLFKYLNYVILIILGSLIFSFNLNLHFYHI